MSSTDQPAPGLSNRAPSTWTDRALFLATVLTCAVALSPNKPDPDLWGHVQYGRDVLRGGLPACATYSYTAEGYPWVNHENLAELVLAAGMDTIGPVGMLIVKCLAGVGMILLMMEFARRRGVAPLTVNVVALLVAVNLSYSWSMRPHLATSICYALLLAVLDWSFSDWQRVRTSFRDRRSSRDANQGEERCVPFTNRQLVIGLWLLPVVFVVWANSHGGFVAGLAVYAVYLAGRSWEALAVRGRAAWGLIHRFALLYAAAVLATMVNPYGIGLHLWLRDDLGPPRPEILEWRVPDVTSSILIPFWLILGTWVAVLLLTRRPRDLTHLAILTLTLWQSLTHQRHISFFAITFGFWMMTHVDCVLRRFNIVKADASLADTLKPAMRWALTSVLALAFVGLGYRLYYRLNDMPVDRAEYPVSAFQYIADENLHGRMVVTFNWAQYALAAFGGGQDGYSGMRISCDGRLRTCYPQETIDMTFDFMLGMLEPRYRCPASPPFNDARALEYGQPNLVLIDRYQPHSVNVMFRHSDRWTLLYQDKIAQIWGRSAKYDDPLSPAFLPTERRRITDDKQKGSVTWPALPQRRNPPRTLPLVSRESRVESREPRAESREPVKSYQSTRFPLLASPCSLPPARFPLLATP